MVELTITKVTTNTTKMMIPVMETATDALPSWTALTGSCRLRERATTVDNIEIIQIIQSLQM